MKKRLLLSALLCAASALSLQQGVFAASANQTIHATLAAIKSVVVAGDTQPSGGTIDEATGDLGTTIVPAFVVTSNASGTGTLHLYGKTGAGAAINAIAQPGGVGTPIYIALGNVTVGQEPTALAVADAISASPTIGGNANCIAYTIHNPDVVNLHGSAFTFLAWNDTSHWWPATVSLAGRNHVANTVDKPARGNTFTDDDTEGSYEAVIYLDFT